jgi:rhodanese-related sulfurtransferase
MSASSTRSHSPPGRGGGHGSEVSNFTSASQVVRNLTNVLSAINTALPTPTTPHPLTHDQQWPRGPVQTTIDNDQLQLENLALSLNQIQLDAQSPPPVIPGQYIETETSGPQSQSTVRPRSPPSSSRSTDAVYPEGYAESSTPSTARPPSVALVHRVHTQPEEHVVLSPSTFRSETESIRSYGPYRHRQFEDQTEPAQSPSTIRPPRSPSNHGRQNPYHHQEVYHHVDPDSPSSPSFPQSPYHRGGHSPAEDQLPQRTIEDVRFQVACSIAARTIRKAELVDGSKVGVVFTLNKSQDDGFLRVVAGEIRALLNTGYIPSPTTLTSPGSQGPGGFLFAVATSSSAPSNSNRGTTRSGHSQSHYSYSVPSQSFMTGSGSRRRNSPPAKLVIVGSSPVFVHRAMLLTRSKFLGRTVENPEYDVRVQRPEYVRPTAAVIPRNTGVIPTMSTPRSASVPIVEQTTITPEQALLWEVGVYGLGGSSYDEIALRDVVKKSVGNLMEPLVPPPGSLSVAQLLSHTRAKLERMTPDEAFGEATQADEMAPPVFLVDIRSESQRRDFGTIPGSIVIDRNELEWKLDPRSRGRLGPSAMVNRFDVRVILMSHDGNASSLAARSLHLIGLRSATDVVGGFLAWRAAGLPFNPWVSGDEREHQYEDTSSSATERVHAPVVGR